MTTLAATSPAILTHDALAELVAAQTPPCVSLFQPTHRMHPDNRQDPIRFRNLVDQARASLAQVSATTDAGALLAPLDALAGDGDFWNHASAGLAVLAAPGVVGIFRLERSVRAFVVVADSFHTKPLRRHLQSVDRYQVLALSRHRALVFQGDRDALDEIAVAGVPRTMTEALGEEVTDPHLTVASYGGVGGESGAMHHGHGGRKDEIDIDTTRFFRAVDRAFFEHCWRPSGLPLILAALPEHHQPFAEISHNPSLIAHGVRIDPFGISHDKLRKLA
nr:hypothetical protein [Planctomycetota bacterium]